MDRLKSPMQRTDWESVPFTPELGDGKTWKPVELKHEFINPKPGDNFSFGLGLGMAITLEKTSPGMLELPAETQHGLEILVKNVQVQFTAKPRNEKVTS